MARTEDAPLLDEAQQVHLHLGAHKTATTHLQQIFLTNREALANHGVHYDGPAHLRGKKWLTGFRSFTVTAPRNLKQQECARLRSKKPLVLRQ